MTYQIVIPQLHMYLTYIQTYKLHNIDKCLPNITSKLKDVASDRLELNELPIYQITVESLQERA
jgi:hypothetical protein